MVCLQCYSRDVCRVYWAVIFAPSAAPFRGCSILCRLATTVRLWEGEAVAEIYNFVKVSDALSTSGVPGSIQGCECI